METYTGRRGDDDWGVRFKAGNLCMLTSTELQRTPAECVHKKRLDTSSASATTNATKGLSKLIDENIVVNNLNSVLRSKKAMKHHVGQQRR